MHKKHQTMDKFNTMTDWRFISLGDLCVDTTNNEYREAHLNETR